MTREEGDEGKGDSTSSAWDRWGRAYVRFGAIIGLALSIPMLFIAAWWWGAALGAYSLLLLIASFKITRVW